MRTGNPILKSDTFQRSRVQTDTMTMGGTVAKISLLFIFLLGTAVYTWYQYALGADVTLMMMIGAIGGLIFALITSFFPKAAPVTAPIYAALEGFFIGGVCIF